MRPKTVRKHGFDADFAYGPPEAFHAARQSPHAGRLYVDRLGREREESYVIDGSERELVSVDIWDVVAGKYYALSPTDKKVLWEDPIDPQEGRIGLDISLPGIMSIALPRHSLSGKKRIGTKQIEGLTCTGAVMERVVTDEYPGFVIESWYAEEIAYVVLANTVWTLSDGSKVETTFRLNKIRLQDPEPNLFQVPTDYTPAKLVPVKN